MTHPNIKLYHTDYNTPQTDGNIICAAPCERLKLCVEFDKSSYNSELINNNSLGTFDSNLNLVGYWIQSVMPNVGTPFFTVPMTLEDDNDTTATYCLDIRVPDQYAGQSFFVIIEAIFRVPKLSGATDTEKSWLYYQINVKDYSNFFQLGTVTDNQGNIIDGAICADEVDIATINLIPQLTGRDVLAVIHEGSLLNEFNPIAGQLPQLLDDGILFLTETALSIDPVKFQEGETCIKIISKAKEPVIVEPVCDPITVTLTLTVLQCDPTGTGISQLEIAYNVVGGNIASVNVTGSASINSSSSSGSQTFTQTGLSGGASFDISIMMDNGCVYNTGQTFLYDCSDLQPQIVNQTVNAQ